MNKLIDSFGRQINYVRLAVTDRCNLRCQYCMPAHGIEIVPRDHLLTYKEMYRVIRVLTELGVNKIRLTGGEPFVRKGFVDFLEMLSFNDLLEDINITTNGAMIYKHIETLEKLQKVKNINLSIDSLKAEKFNEITRRNVFDEVFKTNKVDLFDVHKVTIHLYVPKGLHIQTSKGIEEIDHSNNSFFDLQYDYPDAVYEVGSNRIKCKSCPNTIVEWTEDNDESNNDVILKINGDTIISKTENNDGPRNMSIKIGDKEIFKLDVNENSIKIETNE